MKKYAAMLIACVCATGCSKSPSDDVTKTLVQKQLAHLNVTDGLKIPKDKIEVVKSTQKDGDQVMVVKIGGMICDMPVIKTKEDWMSRGISCNGSIGEIFTPEEAAKAKKAAVLEKVQAEIDGARKTFGTVTNGVRMDSMSLKNENLIIAATLVDVNPSDVLPDKKAAALQDMEVSAIENHCTSGFTAPLLAHGGVVTSNFYFADKSLLTSITVDQAKCNALAAPVSGQN